MVASCLRHEVEGMYVLVASVRMMSEGHYLTSRLCSVGGRPLLPWLIYL